MCMLSTKIRCFEEETKRSQNVILVSFERERERERRIVEREKTHRQRRRKSVFSKSSNCLFKRPRKRILFLLVCAFVCDVRVCYDTLLTHIF